MSRFCKEFGKEPTGDVHSAWTVWKRTPTAGTDASKAPAGAFHFWDIGGAANGHVGLDILGGGTVVFMGNASVDDIEGAKDLGFQSVVGYNFYRPLAKYVGWTTSYADGNPGPFDLPAAPTPASGGKTTPVVTYVGPVIRSGSDWAYRRPAGDLAKRVVRALQGKGRLSAHYNNDGDPREAFDKAVQQTLKDSKVFVGLIDGKIEKNGCYGIQDYATKFGDYAKRGGHRDGRPEAFSWTCFALGLERP